MPDLVDQVLAILKQAGVQATRDAFGGPIINIPVNDRVTLSTFASRHYGWKIELWSDAAYPGEKIEIPEPVPDSWSTDAEAIAVFILRSLFRAGANNRQEFPVLAKTQPPVSGL